MIRIDEFLMKTMLQKLGFTIPAGGTARTSQDAARIFEKLGRIAVVKPLFRWNIRPVEPVRVTSTAETINATRQFFESNEWREKPEQVLVEEELASEIMIYAGFTIDVRQAAPVLTLCQYPTDVNMTKWHPNGNELPSIELDMVRPLRRFSLYNLVRKVVSRPEDRESLAKIIGDFCRFCIENNVLHASLSPIIRLSAGRFVISSCRMLIDGLAPRFPDAVDKSSHARWGRVTWFRSPTDLEKMFTPTYVARDSGLKPIVVERLETPHEDMFPVILLCFGGNHEAEFFHDYLASEKCVARYTVLLNGSSSASSIYTMVSTLLKRSDVKGFIFIGTGFSAVDQRFYSRAFLKAFRINNISLPGVVRFDTMHEEQAIEVIRNNCWDLPATIEPYGRDNSIAFCMKRLRVLIEENKVKKLKANPLGNREKPARPYHFESPMGVIHIDHAKCEQCQNRVCIDACPVFILKVQEGKAVLAIAADEAKKGGCIDCLACEYACWSSSLNAILIDIPEPAVSSSTGRA